jgi:hypothetical protein
MNDRSAAADAAETKNVVYRLLGVLFDNGTITKADINEIHTSVADLERHGVKATAPGSARTSDAVRTIIRKAKGDLDGLG